MLRFEAFTTAARRTFSPLAQDVGREIGRKLSKSLVNFAQSAFRRLANDLFVRMVLKSLWWRGSTKETRIGRWSELRGEDVKEPLTTEGTDQER